MKNEKMKVVKKDVWPQAGAAGWIFYDSRTPSKVWIKAVNLVSIIAILDSTGQHVIGPVGTIYKTRKEAITALRRNGGKVRGLPETVHA